MKTNDRSTLRSADNTSFWEKLFVEKKKSIRQFWKLWVGENYLYTVCVNPHSLVFISVKFMAINLIQISYAKYTLPVKSFETVSSNVF